MVGADRDRGVLYLCMMGSEMLANVVLILVLDACIDHVTLICIPNRVSQSESDWDTG